MKKPLLIVSENEVVAAADARLDAIKEEAKKLAEAFSKKLKEDSGKEWRIIEGVLIEKGMIDSNYPEDNTKILSIENGVVYLEEKTETKRLLDMMNEKIKELLNDD